MIAEFLENFGMAEWVADAIGDSFAVLPFLFVIFLLVEFFEFYFWLSEVWHQLYRSADFLLLQALCM